MRLFILLISLLAISCKSTQQSHTKGHTLNGQWQPIRQEMGGRAFPASLFQSQLLTIQDSLYTLKAESIDKGVLRYSEGRMDIFGKEGVNVGKHFTAIYTVKKDTLQICYNLKGDTYPTEFSTKGGGLLFMSVFIKSKQP